LKFGDLGIWGFEDVEMWKCDAMSEVWGFENAMILAKSK
jgi:hypothetical protein